MVVPSRCVITTQQGNSVYILGPDGSARLVSVKVGQSTGEEIAIVDGVKVGDTVVTDGQLQLSPGAKTKIESGPSAGGNGLHQEQKNR